VRSRQFFWKARKLPALVLALAAMWAPAARADDSTAAQALFDQGKAAMAAHDYAQACTKFQDSLRLEYGLGTLLNLAGCYEAEGKTASAWTKFLELASKARLAGQADRARIGRERAAALAPKLSNLIIDVPAADRVDGLVVERDGTATLSSEWGTAIPADPGTHTISVSAPGRKPWSGTVLVPREATTTRVAVPELAAAPPAPVARPEPATLGPRTSATSTLAFSSLSRGKAESPRGGLGVQKILAIASGAVGLAGVGVGTYFGLHSLAKHNQAQNVCRQLQCATSQGTDLWNAAVNAGNIATIAFVVGGVGVAGGLALWFTAPGSERAAAPSVGIELGPRRVGLSGNW